eukprot:NODE_2818_length_1334_cov_199.232040_g2677_i0.p1 GENE.NODE_2818_length_1334_cov_199.232040_g2677_i0~~NODE_2818_length_1334_cov_199.232040_g2677_i0.p1  ORF type:complete len:367 (-),score=184.34 NODE_2818_length_1334_cov_199.232040_g2677_i0:233-1282(-)
MPEGQTEQTLKIVAGFLLVVVFTLAYVLGQNAQTKTQKNMQSRLELTRQRFQNCDTERRMLSGQIRGKEHDELRIAEQDHQALVSENQLLNEDNQQLRQDNYALEEQIDELRDELDDKDFVSDDEVEQLEDAMSLGNNSVELKEFLDDAQILGGINKDTLISKLMTELKTKRQALLQCKKRKGVTNTKLNDADDTKGELPEKKKPWESLSEDEKSAQLRAAVQKIAIVKGTNSTKASALIKKWGKRYPGGAEELSAAVQKVIKKSHEHDDDEEKPKPKPAPKPAPKKVEEDEEEEPPKKKAVKKPVKKVVEEEERQDDDEDDEDDDEDREMDDEEEEKPKKKKSRRDDE